MSIESIISITEIQKPTLAETVFYPQRNQYALASQDIKIGFQKWRIWMMLAYQDIKLRYRRSILGPFWITLSMAITVYSMGYLYGHLFHTNLETYFPFLVGGMLSWALVSTCITELSEGFSVADGLIKQIKLPYSLYIHRVIMRNIIIFSHNVIVIVPILAIYHQFAKINLNTLVLLPNLFLFYVNAFIYGLVLSMIGARYRDISQIIKSLHYLVVLNPFYSFVELLRAPLLGAAPEWSVYLMVFVVTAVGMALCTWMFSKYRSRIVYWL
jgi:lipopolysaccharide transport system permease protein